MARKYRAVERKIHPVTIIAILGLILAIIISIVLLDDNPQQKLYNRYEHAYQYHYMEWNQQQQQGAAPTIKPTAFDKNNSFTVVDHFSNKSLGFDKGLTSYINDSGVTILFLTDFSLLRGFNSVPYVHERLVGSNDLAILDEVIAPSVLYEEGLVSNFIIFEVNSKVFDFEKLYDQINNQVNGDLKLDVMNAPVLIAFKDNEVIHSFDPGNNSITPNNARDFYQEVYDLLTE